MEGVRLQKVIAGAGLMSRRAAEEAIRQGRVSVNGSTVTEMGRRVDPQRDEIRVDAKLVMSPRGGMHYVLLHKPAGCVTTRRDPQGRGTVFDFLTDLKVRLFPVGRLDYDAEGLLLLTDDGPLAHRLQHPRYGVRKVYEVKVKGRPDEEAVKRLRTGVELEEGKTAPAEVTLLRTMPGTNNTWLRIVLHQGWNRQIKRMGEAVGHPVLKIRRTGYGPLKLGDIAPGRYRFLTPEDVGHLYRIVHMDRGPGNKEQR